MQQPKNAATQKRKLNTNQRRNPEQQPKKHKQTNQKRKKIQNINPENTNRPRKHKPTTKKFHLRQTNPEKTKNESRDKLMAL